MFHTAVHTLHVVIDHMSLIIDAVIRQVVVLQVVDSQVVVISVVVIQVQNVHFLAFPALK